MSESPHTPLEKKISDSQTLIFIVFLCVVCGLLLSIVAYSLQNAQEAAKSFDRSKQMLIAAKILTPRGTFQMEKEGAYVDGRFDPATELLVPAKMTQAASEDEILAISKTRIRPLLTDRKGTVYTFEEQQISLEEYLSENKKAGYAALPLKLFYAILPNDQKSLNLSNEQIAKDLSSIEKIVFPVSGFGLWAPIYGYLVVGPDGKQVIGTTWYEHGETPGLGANIAEAWWQEQFFGKVIFQESSSGKTDFETAYLGITVVKGSVQNVLGNSPKAHSAVDGISGATLTGDGVSQAYHNTLTPYRSFLINFNQAHQTKEKSHGSKKSSS